MTRASVAQRPRGRAASPAPGSRSSRRATRAKAEEPAEDEDEDESTGASAEESDEEETTEEYSKTTKSKKSSKGKAEEPSEDEDEDDDEPSASAAVAQERQRVSKIRKEFSQDDPDFALEAVEKGWSLQKAKSVYCDRLRSGEVEIDDRQAGSGKAGRRGDQSARNSGGGGKPLRLTGSRGRASNDEDDESGYSGDAVADFNSAVRAKTKGGMSRAKAVAAVAKEDPDLHQEYLLATNGGRKQQSLIRDRFEMVG